MNARIVRPLATGSLAAAIAAGLNRLRASELPTPPDWHPNTVLEWLDDSGPLVASMSLLRLGSIGVAAYVALAALVCVVATVRPSPRALRFASRTTPRVLRRALGIGALSTLALPATLATARTPAEPPPVLVQVEAAPTLVWEAPLDVTPSLPPPTSQPPPPTTVLPTTAPPTTVPPATAPPTTVPPARAGLPVTQPATRVVQQGEHLWSIAAERVLEERSGATEREIAGYWKELIEANRTRLANPMDPDLVFAGQELILPPIVNQR